MDSLTRPVEKGDPRTQPALKFTYVDISAVDQALKEITSPSEVLGADAPSRARQILEIGDVLVSTVRPNLNAVAIVGPEHSSSIASTGFCVLRCEPTRLDERYLFHWVRARQFVDQMVQLASGASYPAVSDRIVKNSEIPLPPVAEQRRIAALLDAVDALRTSRRDALDRLGTLAEAIFVDMFGDPVSNSKRFPSVSLGDLGVWRSGGTPPRDRTEYFGGAIPWFSSGDLGELVLSESSEWITHEAIAATSAKVVPKGALMLGMYDTAALKSSIAGVDGSCNQAVAFAVIDSSIATTRYVFTAVQIGRSHFRRLQRGIRQKNLNLGMVREIEIPRPSIRDQRLFDERMAILDSHRAVAVRHDHHLRHLFTALQQRAFRGEL